MTVCNKCGATLAEQDSFCAVCGAAVTKTQEKACRCAICGADMAEEDRYCASCGACRDGGGTRQTVYQGQVGFVPGRRSKLVAGLLGIFVGGFGIHNFYLGKISLGVIQIVVTLITCGAGALWGFIEGILLLCDRITTDGDGNPLNP